MLLDRDPSSRRATRLIGATERLLRRFLRQRFGRDPNFQTGQRVLDPVDGLPDSERFDLACTTTDPEIFEELVYRPDDW